MRVLVPHLISELLARRETHAESLAASLFIDISGFTAMTETLMREGKEGAEALSAILNGLFPQLIEAVYERGGLVSTFAGDAFTALFPHDDDASSAYAAAYAALSMQQLFRKRGLQETRFGSFSLSAKVGVAFGPFEYGVLGENLRAYYFRGETIDASARAEGMAAAGEIVCTRRTLGCLHPGDARSRTLDPGHAVLEGVIRPEIDPPHPSPPGPNRDLARQFYPASLWELGDAGEFRRVVSIFLSVRQPDDDLLQRIGQRCLELTAEYDGYFNVLDFGDKGCTMLILFGAPVSHEDDLVRGVDLALALRAEFHQQVRLGLTTGTVYAGWIGSNRRATYTALGDVINLSARLMMGAEFDSVLADGALVERLPAGYATEPLGSFEYKGISRAVPVFQIAGRSFVEAAPADSGQLIGRETELEALRRLSEPLDGGAYAAPVLVLGEAGTGKSRLLRAWAEECAGRREVVFLPADGILKKSLNPMTRHLILFFGVPANAPAAERRAAFDERFEKLRADLGQSPDKRMDELARDLERTRSLLAALVGIRWPGSLYEQLDPQRRFENTLIALKDLFRARSLLRPLQLVFEDAQWQDSDTALVFEMLTRNMDGYPLQLIAAARPDDRGSAPALPVDAALQISELRLANLTERASQEDFIAAKLGGQPAGELVDFVVSRTQGNPFYMEQFCMYLRQDRLEETDGQLRVSGDTGDLPAGVSALLTARLDRTSPDLKEAVQAAAVLGVEFSAEILAGMLGAANVDHLIAKGEREQLWSRTEGSAYEFRQSLLRDTAYEMQLKERLRSQHGRAAELIATISGEDETRYADLAYHYEHAENRPRAKQYLALAGDYARGNYKNERALYFYDRLLAYGPTAAEQVDLLEKKSAIFDLTGHWQDAAATLQQALDLARAANLTVREISLQTSYGEVLQKRGDYEEAAGTLERAAERAHVSGNSVAAARALTHLGRTFSRMGRNGDAMQSLEQAIALHRAGADRHGLALALYYAGVVDRDRSAYDSALSRYEEALGIFRELGDRMYVTYPVYDLGVLALYRGELDRAQDYFQQACSLYEEIGYRSGISAALLNLGVIELRRGHDEHALEFYGRSLEIAQELGEALAEAYALFSVGTVHYQRREYTTTIEYFERAFALMKRIGAVGYFGYVYAYLTCTYARQGQIARALKAALHHFRVIAKIGSDVENGRTHLGVGMALAAARGRLSPKLSELAAAIEQETGVPPNPAAHFEAAIRAAEQAQYVTTLIPAEREYARTLIAAAGENPPSEAATLLKRAAARARTSGMRRELERLQEVAETIALDLS